MVILWEWKIRIDIEDEGEAIDTDPIIESADELFDEMVCWEVDQFLQKMKEKYPVIMFSSEGN